MSMQIHNNLNLFRELLTCAHDIFFWTYDSNFAPITNNCPEQEAFHAILMLDYSAESLIALLSQAKTPLFLVNSFSLVWIVAPEYDDTDTLHQIHVIGPVFYNDIPLNYLESALDRHRISLPLKLDLLRRFKRIPVVSRNRMREYGLMLHYCITGEKINVSDIRLYQEQPEMFHMENSALASHHGSWATEQEMLKLVEEGNLDYRHGLDRLLSTENAGFMNNGDPIRQAKNSVIIYTALCTRAAIRGGLPPETAFSLSDKYLQHVETCGTLSGIAKVSDDMLEDFIFRVHQCKSSTLSPQIKECCDYIRIHIKDELNIEMLASKFGYSKYYLSRKFKQETGMGIREYMNQIKIEKSLHLLESSQYNIQKISEILGFHSQSYFGELFHKKMGMTPKEYRECRFNE